MATIKPLLDYLPLYMQQYIEMQKIMNAEQTELNSAWSGLDNVWNNQYIQTATSEGVERWETMLGISPKQTDTLDERRFRILALLNQELPYTMRKLQQVLTTLCGSGGFSIELDAAEYYIEIRLSLINKNNYDEVENILTKMIPANIVPYIRIMYNTHAVLHAYTHDELSAYTHDELRNEVIN